MVFAAHLCRRGSSGLAQSLMPRLLWFYGTAGVWLSA
jgi:hypothetical protein